MTTVPRMPTTQAEPIEGRETRRPPIEMMLRDLPAPHREIIVATYFGRRTTREAADLLGLAPAEAKARLYEAMHDLSGMVMSAGTAGPP